MKKVFIFFKDRKNPNLVEYITQSINYVFNKYVNTIPYYLDDLEDSTLIDADAHIVLYEEDLPLLSDHLTDFSKVIILKYCMSKSNLEPLKDIPAGEDVLVINDSRESTLQTIYMLYELGYNHISLYPYIEDSIPTKSYDSFEFCAVTNDSMHLVPSTCRKIVNLQNRDISFETFQKLMHVLELDSHVIQNKIVSTIDSSSDIKFDFIDDFLSSELKAQLLTNIMETFAYGLILYDKNGKVHYVNEKGFDIFGVYANENLLSSPKYDASLFDVPDFKNKLVTIGKYNYMAEKKNLSAFNYPLGSCLILQDERSLRDRETSLSRQLKSKGLYAKHTFDDIIYSSNHMKRCIQLAKQAAPSDYTVLIRGESGTGKELLAQSIHNYSHRSRAPFVAINCAALPETLLESELFGYEEGAFTGAQKHGKTGLFEQAQHGTIFLDEIGDISPNLQSRLLRVLQEKQVMRIGSDKIIDIDVRVIAATNADLEAKIKEGKFRTDLFYRLNVINLNVLPLRGRKEDILPLLKHFLGKSFSLLSSSQKELLTTYHWPGNVRELENTAAYYKLLKVLPDNLVDAFACDGDFDSPSPNGFQEYISVDYEAKILEIIAQSSKQGLGIGRVSICNELSALGYFTGEGRVKGILKSLQRKGLIESNLGRGGSRITKLGLDYIEKN